jgi:hypothetical protein
LTIICPETSRSTRNNLESKKNQEAARMEMENTISVSVPDVLKRRVYEAMDIMRSGWNIGEPSHTINQSINFITKKNK